MNSAYERICAAQHICSIDCNPPMTIAPPFMIEQGYNRKNPYCSGVVELEEGGRVDARIEGVDAGNPEAITVGMPLKVKFLHRGEGDNMETYLAFEPVTGTNKGHDHFLLIYKKGGQDETETQTSPNTVLGNGIHHCTVITGIFPLSN